MQDLVMLKIGGSVCTEKSKSQFKVRTKAVERIAAEIAAARKENDFRLIVVNGAGPFGHVNVTDYDIDSGLQTPRDYEGFIKTVCDCGYLNWRVSDILRKNGILAYPFPTSSVTVQSGKRVTGMDIDVIKRLWEANPGITPVMNGTMVPDLKLKGSVVSGDAVIENIAGRLKPRRIVFATDIDGIFTADPRKSRGAKLIDVIRKDNFGDVKAGISGSSNVDVTGGMIGKVSRFLDMEIDTLVINGNVSGRVKDALLGKPVRGTLIAGK
jgi:isopentenyl phosphate kinase